MRMSLQWVKACVGATHILLVWSLYIFQDLLHRTVCVFCVVFTKPPYEVRETGWGEFEIQIKIYFQDSSEKPVSGGYG